jgi:hypothetical protein
LAFFYTLSFIDYIYDATHLLTILTLLTLLITFQIPLTAPRHITAIFLAALGGIP